MQQIEDDNNEATVNVTPSNQVMQLAFHVTVYTNTTAELESENPADESSVHRVSIINELLAAWLW